MKKNHTPLIAAMAVFSIVLLAGCTELPGKTANSNNETEYTLSEGVQQDFGESVKQEIGKAAANVEQAVQETADKIVEEVQAEGIRKELTASQDIGSTSVLSLDNSVGEIEVAAIAGDKINVNATLLAHSSSAHETDLQEILDNAEISIKTSGDKLKITTHSKESPKKDLWTWAQNKYGYSDFSISYKIEIPASMDMYQINNNVGKIHLRDLQGTYRITSDVGAIGIEGARFTGKSTVETDTGSIRLDIIGLDSGSSLKAKSDVGSISAVLADDLKYSLDTQSELGQITGAADGRSDVKGGGPLLSLSTDIGAITVE